MKNYSKIMSIFLFLSIFDPIVSMQKEDIENTKGIQEAKERAFNQAAKIKLYQLKCQIEEIFKDNDYDIACDKCSEILKSVVFNKILFDKIGEELINFKDKCKVSAFKLDKVKKVQYQIRAIFMNSPYESAYPQAIKFLKLCLSKDSELSNFKKHLFDSVEEFKKRALSAEINRVKTILINIFQEISYDRACDEAAALLQLELSTNKYLMEFSNDFINFIEECKNQNEDSKESYDKAL